jgi:ubiquinol-cytochrome c reductase iron-sulfur subunit
MAEVENPEQAARRDFIVQAALAFAGTGAAVSLWPFIDQMNPNRATPPPEGTDVDLSAIQPGRTISVRWRTAPIFIRNRTPEEVQIARSAPLSDLPDRLARNDALPKGASADDANRTKPGHDNWLVVVGLCTHLGCVLKSQDAAEAVTTGEGWLCPCHAARFDLSGRVRAGPARTNLPVPPYTFLTANRIRIG